MKTDRSWGLAAAGAVLLSVILSRMFIKHRRETKQLDSTSNEPSDK